MGRRGIEAALLAMLPAAAAGQGRWEDWDDALPRATALLEETGAIDPDIAWALELAGDRAAPHSTERACRAWELAESQWLRLDRSEEAASVRRRLQGLG